MGAVAQNRLIPQKFHKNQNCRVSKSKIIMCLWILVLKARKAGNRPRTFYTGLTVVSLLFYYKYEIYLMLFYLQQKKIEVVVVYYTSSFVKKNIRYNIRAIFYFIFLVNNGSINLKRQGLLEKVGRTYYIT